MGSGFDWGISSRFDPRGIHSTVNEVFVEKRLAMQWNGRLDPFEDEFVKSPAHPGDGFESGRGVDDQLAQQGVIVRGYAVAEPGRGNPSARRDHPEFGVP